MPADCPLLKSGCSSNCEQCVRSKDKTLCLKCASTYELNADLACQSSCSNGWTIARSLKGQYYCVPCHFTCAICLGATEDSCLTCASGLYKQGSKCQACPSGSYITSANKCEACPTNCLSCGLNSGVLQCHECKPDYLLQTSTFTCVSSCPQGNYPEMKSKLGYCESCPSSCQQC